MKARAWFPVLTAILGVSVASGCQLISIFWAADTGAGDNAVVGKRQSAALISNNAGALGGKVLAPASLISNNAGNIVSNNAASVISNNAATYRVMALSELPVAKAKVQLVGKDGHAVAATVTDQTGAYSFSNLPIDQVFVVQVSFTVGTVAFQEMAIAKPAPQAPVVQVDPATTLVTAKVVAQVGQGAIDQVNLTQVQVAITAVAQVQTDQNTPAQALTSPTQAATTFDAIAQTNPTVSQPVQAAVSPVTNPSPAATPTPSPSPSTLKGGISS
jgi:hypothetical protein